MFAFFLSHISNTTGRRRVSCFSIRHECGISVSIVCVVEELCFLLCSSFQGTRLESDESGFGEKVSRTMSKLWHAMWDVRWTGFTLLLTLTVTLIVFPSIFVLLVPYEFDAKNLWHSELC